jgi:hypothetical protein
VLLEDFVSFGEAWRADARFFASLSNDCGYRSPRTLDMPVPNLYFAKTYRIDCIVAPNNELYSQFLDTTPQTRVPVCWEQPVPASSFYSLSCFLNGDRSLGRMERSDRIGLVVAGMWANENRLYCYPMPSAIITS